MKLPKVMRKFCPNCKQYQEMAVALTKVQGKNKVHPLSRGSRARMRRRGQDRGCGNHGSTSRGAMSSWKMYGVKTSKKANLTLKCKVCGKSQVFIGARAKRIELAAV